MPSVESVAERIRDTGQTVTFTRQTEGGPVSVSVKAFVRGYSPQQLVGDINQGDREVRVAPGDMSAAGWPSAPREPDQIRIGNARAVIQDVETRMLGDTPCMYIIHVRGG